MTNTRRRSTRTFGRIIVTAAALGWLSTACTPDVELTSSSAPMCSTDADCASKGYADAYGVTPDKIRLYSDRYYLGDGLDPVADCLLVQGYRGLPGDGEEVIYAGRDAIEGCSAVTV